MLVYKILIKTILPNLQLTFIIIFCMFWNHKIEERAVIYSTQLLFLMSGEEHKIDGVRKAVKASLNYYS